MVIGKLGRILVLGVCGADGLEHRRWTAGVGFIEVLVIEEYGFEAFAHMPLDVVRQHAQEYICAYTLAVVVEDRTCTCIAIVLYHFLFIIS